jgi:uncharacterized membrane protein YdjX (TVP38/TMEM64 family)
MAQHEVTTTGRDPATAGRLSMAKLVPLAAIVLLAIAIIAMGWHRELSLEALVRHRAALDAFIESHLLAALAAFLALYVAAVALSIPGAVFLTVTAGILFGWLAGGLVAAAGATIGATIIFLIAKTALGEHLAQRLGAIATKLAEGFREDAFSYLLFLRLVPAFPFFAVNLVPALAGIGLGPFVAATALGIIPATFTFAFVGAGLDSAIAAPAAAYNACVAAGHVDCALNFNIRSAITPKLLAALSALALLALVPLAVKRLRARGRVPERSG